jgi:SAM-dependent methyltransferase
MYSKRTECRSCFYDSLKVVADFGPQPLAGFYPLTVEQSLHHKRYPMVLEGCPACGLLQITDLPPITEVFHENYTYSSSQVAPLVNHFAEYAQWLAERIPMDARILEFGCNDGVLLDQLEQLGFSQLQGVDASANMVAIAQGRGLKVIQGFFGQQIVQKIGEKISYDLITCSNVFAHIDDLKDVLLGVSSLLSPTGQFCIEVHDAERLIAEGQFETIYHEHLTYFSADSLRKCLQINGFEIIEVIKTPMHGGGLRVRAQKSSEADMSLGLHFDSASFVEMGRTLLDKVGACRNQMEVLFDKYGPIDAYGIAGRAQMFVAMTSTQEFFGAMFDDAPIRQGRYQVGTSLKIQPFAPDVASRACVILAWNYAEAIFMKISKYYDAIYVMFPNFKQLK